MIHIIIKDDCSFNGCSTNKCCFLIDSTLFLTCDASSLSASMIKLDGRLIRIEPQLTDSNDNATICSYKATIETSSTEEYSLTLPRDYLLQCVNVTTDSSNITEAMLSHIFVVRLKLIQE